MRVVAVAAVLLLLDLGLLVQQVSAQNNHQFEIIQTRPLERPNDLSENRNLVRLECRSNNDPFGPQDIATFYRNSTIFKLSLSGEGQTITFVVDRFTDEGLYSCGADEADSEEIPVIAYPVPNLQVEYDGTTTIRAKVGSTAVLPSYIRPGIWHSRYYIDWYKNSQLISRIDGLRSSQPVNVDQEGISVDPANFSLSIENVLRSDTGAYHGVIGVIETTGNLERSYDQTRTMPIVLEVYEGPVIRMENEKVVVKKEKNTDTLAVFECTATGYPRPTIHWTHQLSSDSEVESVNDETSDSTARSILRISNAHPADSGKVGCYAVVNPGGNVVPLVSETVEAELSVLKIFQVKVYRTTGDELVFTVHLGENVMVPTGLRIRLHEEDNSKSYTSPEEYKGTNPITYIFPNEVHGSTVSVVIVDSEGHKTSEPYSVDLSGLNKPCSYNREIFTVVVPVGAGLFIAFLIFIIAILIFALVCWVLKSRKKDKVCNNVKEAWDTTDDMQQRLVAFGQFLDHLNKNSTKSKPTQNGNSSTTRELPLQQISSQTTHVYDSIDQTSEQRYVREVQMGPPPPPSTQAREVLPAIQVREPSPNFTVLKYTRELSKDCVVPHECGENDTAIHSVLTSIPVEATISALSQAENCEVTISALSQAENGEATISALSQAENGEATISALSQAENGHALRQQGSSMQQIASLNESVGTIRGKGGDSEPHTRQRRKKKDKKCDEEYAKSLAKNYLQIKD